MTDFDKLPFYARRVIERCRRGERLCMQHRVKETGEPETLFYFEPSGRKAGVKGASIALKTDFLTPTGDGLLGVESSQTWMAAP